jgi:hypothetical protein
MDQFLERKKLAKVVQDEIDKQNSPVNEIGFIFRNLSKKNPNFRPRQIYQ